MGYYRNDLMAVQQSKFELVKKKVLCKKTKTATKKTTTSIYRSCLAEG